jgi:ABC-type lipoprotein release transport system permease subunit
MEGEFLKNGSAKKVVLGKKLAKTLDVTVGSELVVLVQAADGSLGTDIFYVAGILKAAGDKIDRATAFFRQSDFRELFVMDESMGMQDSVHEIAMNSFGKVELSKMKGEFADVTGDLEFKTWKELNPSIAEFMGQAEKSIIIFAWIFFIVAALGIMNTMLMATYDRIRELGILKAIGATPLRILTDVLTEAFLLTILATVFGLIAGVLLSLYLQVYGIDTSGTGGDMSFAGVAFDPVWKASLSIRAIYIPVTMMWAISVLGAFYPASIAARLKPVEAINHI